MKYELYGLIVESSIDLGRLPRSPENSVVDAEIRVGKVPAGVPKNSWGGARYWGRSGVMYLWLDDIGRFVVAGGNQVTVDPAAEATATDLRHATLSSPMGALLLQRGLIVIHGSAIATPGGAVVFLGPSGAGKSALAAWFQLHGYRVLEDDMSALMHDSNGSLFVFPGCAEIKVSRDTLEGLGIVTSGLEPIRPNVDKFALSIGMGPQTPCPLRKVYVLSWGSEPRVLFEDVNSGQGAAIVLNHTYRKDFVTALGISRDYAQRVRAAVGNMSISVVMGVQGLMDFTALGEAILADLAKST